MTIAARPKPLSSGLFLLCLTILTPRAGATVWPVDPAGTEIFPHLQAVIDSAAVGDTLDLADGIYTGVGNRNLVVNKGLHIRSVSGDATACVLDAERMAQILRFQEISSTQSILEGIGFRNGFDPRWGGGIVIYLSGSPTIRNCIITGCEAQRGGGIAAVGSGQPRLENTWILNNRATQGGGVFANSVSDLVFEDCVIGGNEATHLGGGGIWAGVHAQITLNRCTVALNHATRLGGGFFIHAFSSLSFNESIVRRNCAGEQGADGFLWDQTTTVDFSCSNSNPERIGEQWIASPVFDLGNDTRDPLICGSPGYRCADSVTIDDFYVASNSPCLSSASTCGNRVGALGEQCGTQTPIQAQSWSSLKSKF